MRRLPAFLTGLSLMAASALPLPASAQSVAEQLAYYGLLELAGLPTPQLLYPEPVTVRGGPGGAPAYLRVPPGHAKNWSNHCARYNACARPVYFVDEGWYERTYVPAYQARHDHDDDHRGHGKGGKHKNKGKGHGKD